MLAYLDAFAGISGDMMVGAMLDLGLPLDELRAAIAGLGLEGCVLARAPRAYGPIRATKFDVHVTAPQPARTFAAIRDLLERGPLSPGVRARALAAFRALAQAEGRIHGVAPDDVHFHEVGSADAIADIVGAALGIERLGITAMHVAPLPLGSGVVMGRHGPLPVPAPATLVLLDGFATRPGDGEGEMVTPTGAAILRGFGAVSAPPPVVRVGCAGHGGGTRTLHDRPNVLRVILGEVVGGVPVAGGAGLDVDEMLVVESNIDDMSPELYEHAVARLFEAGAADVTLVPAQMKKGRPAVLLQVLCAPERRDAIAAVLFAETTTIGLRCHRVERLKLPRHVEEVATPYGPIRVKIAGGSGGPRTVAPEYESCRAAARQHGVPLRLVYAAALRAAG